MSIEEIRDWIKNNFRDDNPFDWFDCKEFENKIVPIIPEELKIIELPPTEKKYNCYVFAFGLRDDEDFTNRSNGLFIDGDDIKKLIDSGILVETKSQKEKDYIIYSEKGKINHVGIVRKEGIVISKWSDGPIIEHQTLAVNPAYGTDIAYYKKINPEEIKKAFENKKRKGLSETIDRINEIKNRQNDQP